MERCPLVLWSHNGVVCCHTRELQRRMEGNDTLGNRKFGLAYSNDGKCQFRCFFRPLRQDHDTHRIFPAYQIDHVAIKQLHPVGNFELADRTNDRFGCPGYDQQSVERFSSQRIGIVNEPPNAASWWESVQPRPHTGPDGHRSGSVRPYLLGS